MKIHFTGIGGAGMAPLAELSIARGYQVSGSDNSDNTKCRHLKELGALISIGHSADSLPDDADLLVYSTAIPENNCERIKARSLGIREIRRGAYLAEFASTYARCVSVTGTHGKSSITSALVSILRRCGKNPGFMIGAEVDGMPSCSAGDGDIFVTEADESDGTHTLIRNFLAVVPNVEDDHEWSLGGPGVLDANFRTVAANSNHLLYYASPKCDELFSSHPNAVRLDAVPENFAGLSGFQAANANISAIAAAILGCRQDDASAAAAHYPRVARRMNTIINTPELTVIEDYAHHPTEVAAAIQWLRSNYPDHHLRILFQPHRFARLEKYFDQFAEILSSADSLFVAPVFAAWCESGPVDSTKLAAAAHGTAVSGSFEEWVKIVTSSLPPKSLIAILGAGDINLTIPYFLSGERK